jgi:hypothetical protein
MCEHEHTENGAMIYSAQDIAEDIVSPERGLDDTESPIIGYVLVAIHDDDNPGEIPPVTVIGHKADARAVTSMLSLGILAIQETDAERQARRDELAASVDSTFIELAEKMRAEPGDRNYDGNE